jgi:hypothetical protein
MGMVAECSFPGEFRFSFDKNGWYQFYFLWQGLIFNFLMFVVRNKRNNKFSVIFSVCSVETIITFLKIIFSPPKVCFHGLFGGIPAQCVIHTFKINHVILSSCAFSLLKVFTCNCIF